MEEEEYAEYGEEGGGEQYTSMQGDANPVTVTGGSLFRSEEMALCQLFLQSEAAYNCVSELGELGLVQFRDLNPDINAFQRKFVNEVRRCDEMERKLRFLEKEIKKDGIPMMDGGEPQEAPQPREMIDLEATFEKLEHELREVNQNAEALKKNFLELTELKHILRKTQQFFDEQEGLELNQGGQHQQLIQDEGGAGGGLQLGFVAGVILRERLPAFEKMLWRACRGNVFLRVAEIEDPLEDPHTGDQVFKSVFVTFFQGEQLKSRVKKICEGFRATLYPCPDQASDRREMTVGVMQRLEDLNTVLGLINAYGVASYREADPAVYTIITFPFLFAIMFGDAGHGVIMFGFAFWCIMKEKQLEAKKSDNEIWNYFFNGRYLIALMGLFSTYTGLIYNDIFSKSLNIFGSAWQVSEKPDIILESKSLMLQPAMNRTFSDYSGSPYPFGIDPVWQISTNKIVFLNSFKMKISIIIGVIHMMFGLLVSFWNSKFFGKAVNITMEFIPQLLFLCCMFGYMSLLMFHKWTAYTAGGFDGDVLSTERCAPSILITFINMVLFKYDPENGAEPLSPECGDPYMYAGQTFFQRLFVTVAVACIPWMLLGKPLLKRNAPKEPGEETEFSEIMILQGIHIIEFVLGTVSHTASYLRLWALSLAHAQLSDVLWAIFGAWAVLTVGILCLMEGLSAFLHTLRLHWVEFQSKFYSGSGYLFIPFSFETILKQAEDGD